MQTPLSAHWKVVQGVQASADCHRVDAISRYCANLDTIRLIGAFALIGADMRGAMRCYTVVLLLHLMFGRSTFLLVTS
jgi:hypothetical protein